MADIRRLRGTRTGRSFEATSDDEVMLWGNERMWACRITQSPKSLWLYYRLDRSGTDEFVDLIAVYDYLHE